MGSLRPSCKGLPYHSLGSRKDVSRVERAAKRCNVRRATVLCLVRYTNGFSFVTTNVKGTGSVSNWTLHAEEVAVNRIRRNPYGLAEIRIMRLTNGGHFANSRPCCGCKRLLAALEVPIYHTTEDGSFQLYDGQSRE